MNLEKHSEQADRGWGDMYYHVIPSLINKFNLKKMCEIGVAFAGHADAILSKTDIDKFYAVDSYQLSETTTDNFTFDGINYNQNHYNDLYEFAKKRLERFEDRSVFIRKTSEEASLMFDDDSIDIVFIDGEHTYSAIKNDINKWQSKVKMGGIISGHDYNHGNFPDIKKFVDEWCLENKYTLNIEDGYVWWVIKDK